MSRINKLSDNLDVLIEAIDTEIDRGIEKGFYTEEEMANLNAAKEHLENAKIQLEGI